MSNLSIGFSNFFLTNSLREKGNSYTTLPPLSLLTYVQQNWDKRRPGTGEGDRIDRKVLVPIHPYEFPQPVFFCPPRAKMVPGMNVQAQVVCRQEGEEPYVEVFVTPEEAAKYGFEDIPAKKIDVVCYSAEALLENNGTRTGDQDWEIVTLLCSESDGERMTPLTMARNALEMVGGTKPAVPYTSDEWAWAVWEHSTKRGIKVRRA